MRDPRARLLRAQPAALPDTDLNPLRDPPLDFPSRAFAEMTPADYAEIGFRCGLEVHQQILTRGKLFCRCPAGRRVSRVDAEVLRHMRPTLSELGEFDGCALMEFKTRKEIVYLIERSTSCTYELDDTPPFALDEEAVRIALEISRLFGLGLVSEVQVMRKQYLDGSIPTGFQRTALIGQGGVLPFRESELGPGRELRVRQLTIEEDSCREVSDVGHRITFRTDRLGTPLVETVTEPDLLTPRDVQAGGLLLARVARASGKVRRGCGAARQDVNVSIAGTRRIELKGVPSLKALPRLVHGEALRHLELLRLAAELQRRGVAPDLLRLAALPGPQDQGSGWPWEADSLVIDARFALRSAGPRSLREAIFRGDMACAIRLPGFRGLLSHPTQPGHDFAHELSERARVIACLQGAPILLHDGEPESLGPGPWAELRRALRADGEDAVVLTWGSEIDAATAASEILARAREAISGVPSETRQAHADGTTGFERILPGPQRMDPDTDTPPLPIPDAWVEEVEGRLPERPWERADRLTAMGLPPAAAARLAVAPWAELFDALAPSRPETRRRLASALERRLVHRFRETSCRELPAAERLQALVRGMDEGALHPAGFDAAFDRLLRDPDIYPEAILAEHRIREADSPGIGERVSSAARELASTQGDREAGLRHAMGQVMRAFPRGRVDAREVRTRLESSRRQQLESAP